MRNVIISFGSLMAVFFSVIVFAGEIRDGDLIQFQPNTKARAEEVNANFEAVKNAVNDNYDRIQSLESFKSHVVGISCVTGNAVTGFSVNGTPQCEDLNKGKKILSVTYPASCFAFIDNPRKSSIGSNIRTVYAATIYDIDGNDDPNIIYCPFSLPEGVKILKVIVDLYDLSTTNDLNVYFYHRLEPSGPPAVHNMGATYGNSGDQRVGLNLSSENEIVQRGIGYGIYVHFPSDQDCSSGTPCNSSDNLGVYRATVIYEYDPTYSGPAP